jgi:hypothetical protein
MLREIEIGDDALVGSVRCRENEARRRTVREQSALGVGDPAFGCTDTTAAVNDVALGPDLISLQCNGSDERNLKFERCAADAFIEHRLDGQTHAAIEKSRGETAVHCAPWIEVGVCRMKRYGDATAFGFHDVITQGLCNRVQGQLSIGKTLDEL